MACLLRRAGFRPVATTRMAVRFGVPATTGFLRFIRVFAGPVLHSLPPLDDARAVVRADIAARLETYQTEHGGVGPNSLLPVAGQIDG